MLRFQYDRHTMRFEHFLKGVSHLLTDPFLHRKAACEQPQQAGQFGQSDDVFVGNVTNVSFSIKGKNMVFAKRIGPEFLT